MVIVTEDVENFFLIVSRVHALSVGRSVGRSVGLSVCRSVRHILLFFMIFNNSFSLTSLPLPKWSSDLRYGPCPPTRLQIQTFGTICM